MESQHDSGQLVQLRLNTEQILTPRIEKLRNLLAKVLRGGVYTVSILSSLAGVAKGAAEVSKQFAGRTKELHVTDQYRVEDQMSLTLSQQEIPEVAQVEIVQLPVGTSPYVSRGAYEWILTKDEVGPVHSEPIVTSFNMVDELVPLPTRLEEATDPLRDELNRQHSRRMSYYAFNPFTHQFKLVGQYDSVLSDPDKIIPGYEVLSYGTDYLAEDGSKILEVNALPSNSELSNMEFVLKFSNQGELENYLSVHELAAAIDPSVTEAQEEFEIKKVLYSFDQTTILLVRLREMTYELKIDWSSLEIQTQAIELPFADAHIIGYLGSDWMGLRRGNGQMFPQQYLFNFRTGHLFDLKGMVVFKGFGARNGVRNSKHFFNEADSELVLIDMVSDPDNQDIVLEIRLFELDTDMPPVRRGVPVELEPVELLKQGDMGNDVATWKFQLLENGQVVGISSTVIDRTAYEQNGQIVPANQPSPDDILAVDVVRVDWGGPGSSAADSRSPGITQHRILDDQILQRLPALQVWRANGLPWPPPLFLTGFNESNDRDIIDPDSGSIAVYFGEVGNVVNGSTIPLVLPNDEKVQSMPPTYVVYRVE